MLTKLAIKNFKAHVDTDLDLKPITVFIGPNNSGKSSIFQILLLYKQKSLDNANTRQLYNGSINRSWNGNDVLKIHGNNLVDIGNDPNNLKPLPLNDINVNIEGEVHLNEKEEVFINIRDLSIKMDERFADPNLLMSYHINSMLENKFHFDFSFDYQNSQRPAEGIKITNVISDISFTMNAGFVNPISLFVINNSKVPDIERKKEEIIINALGNSFYKLIRSIHFVYGIRGFELYSEQLLNGDNERLEYLGLPQRSIALGNILLSNKEMEEKVSNWFDKILDLKFYSEASQGANVVIKIKQKKNKLMINEGLGSQQMLHMLIPIALADELDTIIIEEPEIHLHPRTQSDLTNLFLKVWREEKKQIIYSTHSEHMIYPILSSISRGEIKKEDVAIFYFSMENGAVKVRPLEINDKGMVRGGLPGFFEKDLDELIEFLER
jgi:predicted ATPase